MLPAVHSLPPTATHQCGSLVAFVMLNFASVTPLMLTELLKRLGLGIMPAMTWFPVAFGQVGVEGEGGTVVPLIVHNALATAFGGMKGFTPPQVPPPLPGGVAGYWAIQPQGIGVMTLKLLRANIGTGLVAGYGPGR